MIHHERTEPSVEAWALDRADAFLERFEREAREHFARPGCDEPFQFNSINARLPYVRQEVIESFGRKCAYCETPLHLVARAELNLFRPNQLARQRRASESSLRHYWWLAFDLANVLPACSVCATEKGATFPVQGKRADPETRGLALEGEEPLLLDPCRDRPEAHLHFLSNGFVEPRNGSVRGAVTIEALSLNRRPLVERRRGRAAFLRTRAIGAGPHDWREALEPLADREQPFSALSRDFIADLDPREFFPTRVFHASPEPTDPPVGSQHEEMIGRVLGGQYEIQSFLDHGGQSSIYLATDRGPVDSRLAERPVERRVAVKIPRRELLSEGFSEALMAECEALVEINHTFVVNLLAFDVDDGLPYLVMEYLAGESLRERIGIRRMSPREVCQWLLPIAEALDFGHKKRRLHRDVKPGNILFHEDGNPRLADYGISTALAEAGSFGRTSRGTPRYMAPEFRTGQISGRYDQYALGAVVYECLCGQIPHQEHEDECLAPLDLPLLRREALPRSLLGGHGLTDLSPAAEAAVFRALSRDPDDRFDTCAAFAGAFAT